MINRSLVHNLPKDPCNSRLGSRRAVVQSAPWRFMDIYASKEAVDAEALLYGEGFGVEYGSHEVGTDNFVGGLTPPS